MSHLSAKDVCAILKACHQNRVLKLTYAGLEVELAAGGTGETPSFVYDPFTKKVKATGKAAEDAVEVIEASAMRQGELSFKEDLLAQLNVEDPAAYEAFLLSDDADHPEDSDEESST